MITKVIPWHLALSKGLKINLANLYSLGIYSEKAAKLLNYVVWCEYGSSPTKWETDEGRTSPGWSRRVHKTKLTKCNVEFFIKGNGEVFAYVNNASEISFLDTREVILHKLKNILATSLKTRWKESHVSAEGKPNGILRFYDHKYDYYERQDDPSNEKMVYHDLEFDEYRALYETLRGRDPIKIVRNNGQEAVDSMVGHPVENELAVNAVSILEARITDIKKEWSETTAEINEDHERRMRELAKEHDAKIDGNDAKYKAKLDEVMAEIDKLKHMAVATA